MGKTSIFMNKFIQAGASILDLSKAHMYGFHYDVMKRQIFSNDEISLLYMDTDSLTYHIRIAGALTERLSCYKNYFDFSNYPANHPLYDSSNKGVLGKMKDEVKGAEMTEFCALKAKLYSYIVANVDQFKKAKGVKKNVVRKTMNFEDYVSCLRTGERAYRTMGAIRSYQHQLFTISQRKIALSSEDDKRCVLEDGIHTLAWGHCNIPHDEDLIYLLNFDHRESSE